MHIQPGTAGIHRLHDRSLPRTLPLAGGAGRVPLRIYFPTRAHHRTGRGGGTTPLLLNTPTVRFSLGLCAPLSIRPDARATTLQYATARPVSFPSLAAWPCRFSRNEPCHDALVSGSITQLSLAISTGERSRQYHRVDPARTGMQRRLGRRAQRGARSAHVVDQHDGATSA